VKPEKHIKINKWTESIKNSNEKRVKDSLKSVLPQYKTIHWDAEKFSQLYIDILNSLPTRYKQKNSIELSGRLKNIVIEEAVLEKLNELLDVQTRAESEQQKEPTVSDSLPTDEKPPSQDSKPSLESKLSMIETLLESVEAKLHDETPPTDHSFAPEE
jgi:hypothetical protein